MTTGLLLLNLGTPRSPTPRDVRTYLREFLSDPYVIDINPVGRWLLLNAIILPFRPKKSAEAYEQIWDAERGSPLMFHSVDLRARVATELGDDWTVVLGMRYGEPSTAAALAELAAAEVDQVIAMPLYPQYALSSTETSVQHIKRAADNADVTFVPPFYDDPGYLAAVAAAGRPVLDELQPDHVLFSFHGMPERHVRKTDPTGSHCLASPTCCDTIGEANQLCYRAQSTHTARAVAAALGLSAERWTLAFQSRLGRDPWIRPYTDEVAVELARDGVKKLAVFSPSFVADCLETLEELSLRLAETFREAGGEQLVLVPSLNSSAPWVRAVCDLARRARDQA